MLVVVLVGIAATQIRTGWVSTRFPTLFAHGDPSLEAVDWTDARALLEAGAHPIVVAANWIDAAKLGAALSPDALVLCFSDDPRQFRYVADQQSLIDSGALIVLRLDPRTDAAAERRRIAQQLGDVDSASERTIDVRRAGKIAVELEVYPARLVHPLR
jgi:precorrin-3B methylase